LYFSQCFFLLLLGQLKGNFVFDQNKKVKNKNHSQTTKIPLKEKKIKLVSRGFFFYLFTMISCYYQVLFHLPAIEFPFSRCHWKCNYVFFYLGWCTLLMVALFVFDNTFFSPSFLSLSLETLVSHARFWSCPMIYEDFHFSPNSFDF
jgi:hypothetical protein